MPFRNSSVVSLALFVCLLLPALAFAQATGEPPQPSLGGVLARMFPMFIMVFFVFYVLVVRPQQQKIRQQQTLLDGLRKGDAAVTTGGMIVRIVSVEHDHVQAEIASGVKIKLERDSIARRWEPKPAPGKEAVVEKATA